MKFVYVFVHNREKFYREQLLLSVLSLKNKNPDAFVSILTDDGSKDVLSAIPRNLINEIVPFSFNFECKSKFKSRFLKTKVRELIKGDILCVDVDTFFVARIDNSFFTGNIMAVPDGNCKLGIHEKKDIIIDALDFFKWNLGYEYYFNSGVVFYKESIDAYRFSSAWHNLWLESSKKGFLLDQPSFNYSAKQSGVKIEQLPDSYNYQLARHPEWTKENVIIHYYNDFSNDDRYSFRNRLFWKGIKEAFERNGEIDIEQLGLEIR